MTGPGPRDPARRLRGTPELGGAPRDGDFARLLELASSPAAHRLGIDPSTGYGDAAGAADRRPARIPYGPPGMVRDLGTPTDRSGAAVPRRTPGETPRASRAGGPAVTGAVTVTGAGAAAGAAEGAGAAAGAAGAAEKTARTGRTLRDRVVAALFLLAGLWIAVGLVSAALESPGDEAGALLVLAVIAFFVLRAWIRPRRRPPAAP